MLYYWKEYKTLNYNEKQMKQKLTTTFKNIVSNMRNIMTTNEYNIKIISFTYLFEYIKPQIAMHFSNFVEPEKKKEILLLNFTNVEWLKMLYDEMSKFNIPDVIYWFFFAMPYFTDDNLDILRKNYLEMGKYILDNWKDANNFTSHKEWLKATYFAYPLFPVSYQGRNNRDIMILHNNVVRKINPLINYTSPVLARGKPSGKIRVCYISDTLINDSSVLRDRIGIIMGAPSKFEIYFASHLKTHDGTSKYADNLYNNENIKFIFLNCDNIDDIRKEIENHKFHVIIYTDIGMKTLATNLAYSRLAPIQINTWGHSETSGISTIDYYFSSKYFEDEDAQNNYSETLIKLNSLSTYYYPPSKFFTFEKPFKTRAELGFGENDIILFSMQSSFKYKDEYEKILGRIMSKLPNAKLLLSNNVPFSRSHLVRLYNNLGNVEIMNRVVFRNTLEKYDFYNLISVSSVVLDTYPFGGCNMSLEAFDYGVPVITCPTKYLNGRFTYGFYKKMDIMDCVAANLDDYCNITVNICTDAELRESISDKILSANHLLFKDNESIVEWYNTIEKLVNKL